MLPWLFIVFIDDILREGKAGVLERGLNFVKEPKLSVFCGLCMLMMSF